MKNYYFTFWIDRYGRDAFKNLTDKVCANVTLPSQIEKVCDKDEYLFHYFYILYCIVTLNYFGLDNEKISLCLDLIIQPDISKIFSPSELLNTQKDVVPDIEKYIEKDLTLYSNNKI